MGYWALWVVVSRTVGVSGLLGVPAALAEPQFVQDDSAAQRCGKMMAAIQE